MQDVELAFSPAIYTQSKNSFSEKTGTCHILDKREEIDSR